MSCWHAPTNARAGRNKKRDPSDCEWIQRLHSAFFSLGLDKARLKHANQSTKPLYGPRLKWITNGNPDRLALVGTPGTKRIEPDSHRHNIVTDVGHRRRLRIECTQEPAILSSSTIQP